MVEPLVFAPSAFESSGFEPSQCLIMAVDDIPENLKILQGLLSATGYQMTFATRGKQVLKRLLDIRPDLILLDLMMPEMNGIEVCTLLKQNPETAQIPIIFLTASQDLEHVVQAFEAGAVDYITKPFKAPELLARVRTHLELSQLRKQAQRQALWETLSRQIVQDIHASIHLQDILNNTVQAIQRLLMAHRALVYRQGENQACKLLAIAGDAPDADICPQAMGHPQMRQNSAAAVLALTQQQGAGGAPELCLPIYQQHRLWGGLVIHASPSTTPWDAQTIETLTLIVQQLEISIQHAELHQRLRAVNQELKRVSNTDALTQIANRRYFDAQLRREWRRLTRRQQPLTLILCDIDYFKEFNDTYGHPSGDACLVAVAQGLHRCLKRPADFLARYGGEEFVVVLPDTELAGAIEVVNQMQGAIAALPLTSTALATIPPVTLSFGIYTTTPQPATVAQSALIEVDRALYAAKQAGRNQYAIVPTSLPTAAPGSE